MLLLNRLTLLNPLGHCYHFAMRPRSPAEILRAAQSPALLITDCTNIRYLTGFSISTGALLVLPRRALLFVDSRYHGAVQELREMAVAVKDAAEFPSFLRQLTECGIEADTVTVSRQRRWKRLSPSTKFVQTVGLIDEFRRSKEPDELRNLRRAERITRELLRRIPAALRKDITEEQLARKLHIWALELGADGLSFDPIVGFGTHTSVPHHHPTSRALKKGHIVQIDVGAKVKGYCADLSEVFFTGEPTPQQRAAYEVLCQAQRKAIGLAKKGVSTRSLDAAARTILRKSKLDTAFTHALGHGVGLDIHEGVSISSVAEDRKLLTGEVITIEPGIYFPGKFGMRVEEMVYVA